VQRQEGRHDEDRVAHAEDVAHRPRGRDGEDIAEEGQVRVRDVLAVLLEALGAGAKWG
jgi:hypothetical protein